MADCQALKILPDLAIEKLAIPLRFVLMGLGRGCVSRFEILRLRCTSFRF
ncbi:MAG: hypothetical protein JGK24_30135 [Microcoleus sp. PH2017_29_MFU_D_A]|nr:MULTISPECIES: hypothetical protein [unclassified Microcoleus]MCC3418938.1 hypothetical protein [Microcoleus sp. PH2017_07_MST_O_A]MCC3429684.1 hypothetical protein [Microcoleus sp. PH2017_04_SCI_O_A]MCC3442809.1 hypothetical protein [Microcoleus sp. PH2017_03_ELD_O_A]MCC3469134.1 hypothetical protein [Microcoleus sp. PH2017_06_SFM_O_A]MCC3492957.1 hypothetical protein [Microcoleus sp. PH2017_16_JOR_D_A]MCC3506479.1 hypothetical protein [Microcoleus sp. PH2017_19_SFW_U_A]MCC3509755.1 hypot